MDQLIPIATIISSVMVILGVVALPMLLFWGRKYFTEKGFSVSPQEMGTAISKEMKVSEHRIREHLASIVGHAELLATSRHESVDRQLGEVKKQLSTALDKSENALREATEARHHAERAMDRVEGLEQRINERLSNMNDSLRRIERSINGGRK